MSVLTVDHTFGADGFSKTSNVPLSIDYMFYATGSFGGGTLSLEASPDDGANWFTVETLTTAGRIIRYLVAGEKIRLALTGSTAANITTGIRQ